MLVDNQGMGIYVMSTKLSWKIQIVLSTGTFFYMLRLGFSMKVNGWCFLVYLFSCVSDYYEVIHLLSKGV